MSLTRSRAINPVRAALEQAMVSPRVQAAVSTFVNALVDEGEAILRVRYAGETLRIYQSKRGGADLRAERNRRIRSLGSPPTSVSPAQIAEMEGISLRQVQRVLSMPE